MSAVNSGGRVTASSINALFGLFLSSAFTQQAYIPTSETTTTVTTYVNLATVGPTVTITSAGTQALVFISSFISATAAHNAQAAVAVSGATTLTAATNATAGLTILNANSNQVISANLHVLTITPGTNTYTMQYTNSGAQTGTWADRKLIVIAP